MSAWRRLLRRRGGVADEVRDEIAFHLEMRAAELVDRGLAPAAARAEALRRMGDVERVRGECQSLGEARERDMRRTEWLHETWQDLKFGARQLARTGGLTAVAVLTLALGIGATAAIFGVVDAVVLRPLPFDHPERVMQLRSTARGAAQSVSSANFLDWRAATIGTPDAVFDAMAAEVRSGLTLTGRDVPVLLEAGRVSAEYFRVFGVRPALGRSFLPEEDAPGRGNVAVLAARTWARYFDADPQVLGRTMQLGGVPYTIVGVMPASFDYVDDAQALWVPLALTAEERQQRGAGYLNVFARLRDGGSAAAAQARMEGVARQLARQFPEQNRDAGIRVRAFAAELSGDYRGRLLTLLGAVAFVLLIGCANVASLLLARGAARAREMALRASLGAGRARLVRQLLTESVVLALLGGIAGAVLAAGLVRAVVALGPDDVPRLDQAAVDGRVLLFTLLLSLASSVVFGLAPALRAARQDLQATLRAGGRGTAGVTRDRLRGSLVAGEVALALVLLTGAGLLTRSAVLLHRVQPGFDPTGVMSARLMLPAATYADAPRIVAGYARILDEVRRTPGVATAGLVLMAPLTDSDANATVTREGRPFTDEHRLPVMFRLASPGYFETIRVPVRRGRDFTDRDDDAAARVAIVNEALARTLWPGEDAVGKRLTGLTASPADPQWTEVVGVVRDMHETALGESPKPEVFYPVPQTAPRVWPLLQRSLVLVARGGDGTGGAAALERPLRHAVARVDASLSLGDVRSLEDYVDASLATARFTTFLLATLSGVGLLLAAVGIYGVIAYYVTQRVPEIGVRMALGATPGRILGLVIRSGLRPVAAGALLGAVASVGATRLLRGFLFGVTPTDPLTIVGVVTLLLGAATLAAVVPARRATRVDPAEVARG